VNHTKLVTVLRFTTRLACCFFLSNPQPLQKPMTALDAAVPATSAGTFTPAAAVVLYSEAYPPPFWPALILVFPLAPLFWMYHVKLVTTNDEKNDNDNDGKAAKLLLSFGYNVGIVTQTIETSHIDTVEKIGHISGLWQWGGWGIRKNLQWETGYICKNGPGVKVILKKEYGGSVFVFNCDDPDQLCQFLSSQSSIIPKA
jgi:hypothetical protein